MREARGNDSEQIKQLLDRLRRERQLEEEDDHIDQDQRARHYRNRKARNRIADGKHIGTYLSDQRHQSAATRDFQFAEDRMKMFFHGFQTQTAFVGNLLIAAPIADQSGQLLFSPGQLDEMRQSARLVFRV